MWRKWGSLESAAKTADEKSGQDVNEYQSNNDIVFVYQLNLIIELLKTFSTMDGLLKQLQFQSFKSDKIEERNKVGIAEIVWCTVYMR